MLPYFGVVWYGLGPNLNLYIYFGLTMKLVFVNYNAFIKIKPSGVVFPFLFFCRTGSLDFRVIVHNTVIIRFWPSTPPLYYFIINFIMCPGILDTSLYVP